MGQAITGCLIFIFHYYTHFSIFLTIHTVNHVFGNLAITRIIACTEAVLWPDLMRFVEEKSWETL